MSRRSVCLQWDDLQWVKVQGHNLLWDNLWDNDWPNLVSHTYGISHMIAGP